MKKINLNRGLLLLTILILMSTFVGCAAQRPELRMMPLAKVTVPKPPYVEPTDLMPILGTIPLHSGQQVLYKNGKRQLIVPETGGVFYPKQSSLNVESNDETWRYYADGVEKAVKFYNSTNVEKSNDQLAAMKLGAKQKSWWKIW